MYLAQFRCRSNKLPISKVYKPEMFYDTTCTLCSLLRMKQEMSFIIYLFVHTSTQKELGL